MLDLVADLRASTPTDAAKRVVPDVREQSQLIEGAIDRMRLRVRSRVENEIRLIEGYANRPSLTQPHTMLEPHQRLIDDSLQRLDIGLRRIVDDAQLTVERAHASLTALSPAIHVEPRLCGGAVRRWPRTRRCFAGKPWGWHHRHLEEGCHYRNHHIRNRVTRHTQPRIYTVYIRRTS